MSYINQAVSAVFDPVREADNYYDREEQKAEAYRRDVKDQYEDLLHDKEEIETVINEMEFTTEEKELLEDFLNNDHSSLGTFFVKKITEGLYSTAEFLVLDR